MSFDPPPLPPSQPQWGAFQVWWQQVIEGLKAEFGALEEAQAALATAVAADGKARNRMDDLPGIEIAGDYTGAIDSTQFPMAVTPKRYDGTTNVTTSSTWSATVESGDISCSINSSTGLLTVTAITTDSVVLITSAKDGLTLRKKQVFTVALTQPPNTGDTTSGGTAWTDTTLNSTSSTTMAAISDVLTVTVGSSGEVDLSAPLTVRTNPAAIGGDTSLEVFGIWQWFDGSSWTDLGTEVASNPDCAVVTDSETGTARVSQEGLLSVAATKTGLTAAAAEKFRLMARNGTLTGTTVMTYSGTASAVS